MATKNERVIVDIIVKSQGAQRSLAQMNKSLQSIDKSSRSVARNMQFFREVTGVATMAIAVQQLGKAFIQTNIAVQQSEKAFKAVFGTMEEGTRQMDYVKRVANEMGAEYLSLTKSYASLSAAAKGTALEGDQARGIFEAITRAMGKLGKSAADTEGALKAIEQAISKGSITAEEWKGQLGERLPGSMQILANALGKTTAEIMDMMEAGDILTTTTLPKVTNELNRLYDDGKKIEGLVQSWNRFKNAVTEATVKVDEAVGVTDALAASLDAVALALSGAGGAAVTFEANVDGARTAVYNINEEMSDFEILAINAERAMLSWLGVATKVNNLPGYKAPGVPAPDRGSYPGLSPDLGMYPGGVNAPFAGRQAPGPIGTFANVAAGTRSGLPARLRTEYTKYNRDQRAAAAAAAGRGGGGRRGGGGGAARANREKEKAAREAERALEKLSQGYAKLRQEMVPGQKAIDDYATSMTMLNEALEKNVIDQQQFDLAVSYSQKTLTEDIASLKDEFDMLGNVANDMGDAFANAFEGMVAGSMNAEEAVTGMLRSIASSIVKHGITDPIGKGLSKGISTFVSELFANGGVTSTGLAHGVYNQPTAFPIRGGGQFANGVGVLGEAGPEAIMPLTRRNGKLGVEGGGVNINVQNYAGADVQTRQGINPGDIDIIISRVADDVARGGGPVGRSIESTYGMSRGRGRR